jgi:hypothetical protein
LEQWNKQGEDRRERLARRARRTQGNLGDDVSEPSHRAVRRALRGEVGKDLVKLPVYEIEKQVLLSGAVG